MAFRAARAADANAKLYYNDYNCDKAGAKSTGAQNLIRSLKNADAPIDGMGLQGHMITGQVGSASGLVQSLNAFTALGVDVAYTELVSCSSLAFFRFSSGECKTNLTLNRILLLAAAPASSRNRLPTTQPLSVLVFRSAAVWVLPLGVSPISTPGSVAATRCLGTRTSRRSLRTPRL